MALSDGSGGSQRSAMGGSGGSTDDCVPVTVEAALTPLNLIFIMEGSSSMGGTEDAIATRWNPVREGFLAFLSEVSSRWTYASLELFPASGDLETACDATNYEVPTVPLLRLDRLDAAGAPFSLALDTTTPAGGTLTLPALLGSLNYARATLASDPASTTVVVLVTDSLPTFWNPLTAQYEPGCTEPLDNTVENVALVAADGLADGILTYVVGVGEPSELAALHDVALAGDTNSATIVETGDAAATATQLQAALERIRVQQSRCTIEVPDVGEQPSLEVEELVVMVDGDRSPIVATSDCETGEGFRFRYQSDTSSVPSQIELCPSTCQTVYETAAEIRLEFPCGYLAD